jgi:hypothetical protein
MSNQTSSGGHCGVFVLRVLGWREVICFITSSWARILAWQLAHSSRCRRASCKGSRLVVSFGVLSLVARRSSFIWSLLRCGFNCFSFLKRLRGQKAFGFVVHLLRSWDRGSGHALAQILGQTGEDAFDTFWGEADAGEIGDGARGKAGAVVEPEDAAVALLIGAGEALVQVAGDLLDEYGALDVLWASGGVVGGWGDKVFFDLFEVAGAALLGVGGFEMIADEVGGEDLDVAGEGVGVLLLEGAEDAEVVGTELEVGLLDEVVYGLPGGVAESGGGAEDDGGDEAVEAADELLPGFGAAGCGAPAHEFFYRDGGGSLHCFHRGESPQSTGFGRVGCQGGGGGEMECRNSPGIVVVRGKRNGTSGGTRSTDRITGLTQPKHTKHNGREGELCDTSCCRDATSVGSQALQPLFPGTQA